MRTGAQPGHEDVVDGACSGTDEGLNEAERIRELERQDVAYQLHDTVIQPLTALVMSIAQFERQAPDARIFETHVSAWKGLAREALDSLRSSLANMLPLAYTSEDLREALEYRLAAQVRRQGLRVSLESRNWPAELPSLWTSQLYLAVREAVTNVQKHARATEIRILLQSQPDGLTITISDDGIGLACTNAKNTPTAPAGSGIGLASMQQRIRLLGGDLKLTSASGCGVRIDIHLPKPAKYIASLLQARQGAARTNDGYVH